MDSSSRKYTSNEMMVVAASRLLRDGDVVFIGIGLPSLAANLARRLHAPNLAMIYESGTLDTAPEKLPLSIGDDELSRTARSVVSVPEMFRYWLQGGRIQVGFLGAAQIDKFANLNTTVIGDYEAPKVRLPGAGGAPEIAGYCDRTLILLSQSKRTFVEKLDFLTSVGFAQGGASRDGLGVPGKGPQVVITDLGILEPDTPTRELVMTQLHPGVTVDEAVDSTSWDLRVSSEITFTEPPSVAELDSLRRLSATSAKAR